MTTQHPLLIDEHEPTSISSLLIKSAPAHIHPLNDSALADYFWFCCDGHTSQIERKQWSELLSQWGEIEEQIRRYMDNADEMGLIVEGGLLPHEVGCETWKVEPSNYVIKEKKRIWERPYSEVLAWLWSLDRQGITTYFTPHTTATAMAIHAFYLNSQKQEHKTLRRYIKTKPPSWIPNPHIQNLVNLRGKGLRIGEVTAAALVERFGTYWGVISRSAEELCEVKGVGQTTAEAIIRSTGRVV